MLRVQDIAGEHIAPKALNRAEATAAHRRAKARQVLMRPLIDAGAAFLFLCLISLSLGIAPSSASPTASMTNFQMTLSAPGIKALAEKDVQPVVEIATTTSADSPNAVFHRTSSQAAFGLLMIALSMVAALNLALFRHMRQAYTPARRRAVAASSPAQNLQ